MRTAPCSPKINLNYFDEGNDFVNDFLDWRSYTQNKVIVLENRENGDLLKIPWITRFDEVYRKKLYAKFMTLVRNIERGACSIIMGTLTVDPKKLSKIDALKQIKGAWHKLHMLLNKRKRSISGPDCHSVSQGIDYVMCVEPHQSGMIHLHYLIFWAKPADFVDDYQIIKRWSTKYRKYVDVGISPSLDRAWQKYGFGHINQFQAVHFDAGRMKQVASYLIKYVSKQHANLPFAAALWHLKVRSYSASRLITSFLCTFIAPESQHEWSFLGIVDSSISEDLSDLDLKEVILVQGEVNRSSKRLILNKNGT